MEKESTPSIIKSLYWVGMSKDDENDKQDKVECAYYIILGQAMVFEACGYSKESMDLRNLSRYIHDKLQVLRYKNTHHSGQAHLFAFVKGSEKNKTDISREINNEINSEIDAIKLTYESMGSLGKVATKASFAQDVTDKNDIAYRIISQDVEYLDLKVPDNLINKGISKAIDNALCTGNEINNRWMLLKGQWSACYELGFNTLEMALGDVTREMYGDYDIPILGGVSDSLRLNRFWTMSEHLKKIKNEMDKGRTLRDILRVRLDSKL